MANANDTSPATTTECRTPERFIPLAPPSQHHANPRYATLYLRADAPADDLFDAAENRLGAVIDLLSLLQLAELNGEPYRNVLHISRSLLLLVSDAQSLYQAEHERRRFGR